MKLSTPEIVWHGKEPIYTADFQKKGCIWRLATGGADNDIKIWKVLNEQSGIKIIFLSSLSRHTKAVNVVRFSPSGEYLASAGDDNMICLWSQDIGNEAQENNMLTDVTNKENWNVVKVLRGHLEDIYDLCWSQDSSQIVTGSVDNSAIIWDVQKGQQICILKESKQYVQGVSWDPVGKFVVTLSNDRNLRVYGIENKFKCLHSVSKMSLPDQDGELKQWRMWIDEGLNSFFRRLMFTPDGSLLIVPAGRYEIENRSKNATYIFARNNWSRPVLQLPGPEKATVVVKCCPVPFELKLQPDPPLTCLSHRYVYAVASLDSLFLYDTQHLAPFAYVSNIHYSGITDMAWSSDGLVLIVTSSDCYCSIITFEPDELGIPVQKNPVSSLSNASGNGTNDAPVPINGASQEVANSDTKPRRIRPTTISDVTTSPSTISPVNEIDLASNKTTTIAGKTETELIHSDPLSFHESGTTSGTKVIPRRVNFITLSSFKKSNSSVSQSSNDRTSVDL